MGQFSISGTAALVHRPRAGGRQFKCQTSNRYFNSNLTLTLCLCSRCFLATLTDLSCPCDRASLSTTDAADRAGSAGLGMEAGAGAVNGAAASSEPPPVAHSRPVAVSRPAHSEQRAAATGGWPFPARRPEPLGRSHELLSHLQADTRRVSARDSPLGSGAASRDVRRRHSVTERLIVTSQCAQRPITAGGGVWCQGRP